MSDPFDDLSALGDGGPLALAPASTVRARGEQRRRTARTAVGLTGAAVLLAAGAAFGLAGSSSPDSLGPEQQATPQPTTSPSPSDCPSDADGTPTVGECGTSPSEVPGAAAEVPDELLLDADDVGQITGGTWKSVQTAGATFAALQVCGTSDIGGIAGRRRSLIGPSNALVVTQVVRFPDSSGGLITSLEADVGRCPSRPDDSEQGGAIVEHELVAARDEASALIRATSRECPTCQPTSRLWLAVQVGDLVSYTSLAEGERTRVDRWAAAVSDRMRACTGRCGTTEAGLGSEDRLTATAIGPVRVGMRLEEVADAAGQPFTAFVDELGNNCGFVVPRSQSPDIALMVVGGEVVRIDVRRGRMTLTEAGLGIGDTLAAVRAAYGDQVSSAKNPYTSDEYLLIREPDGVHGYLFDSDGTVVTQLRAGRLDALEAFESCA